MAEGDGGIDSEYPLSPSVESQVDGAIARMKNTMQLRARITQRLIDGLGHLPIERQIAIITSWISLEDLEVMAQEILKTERAAGVSVEDADVEKIESVLSRFGLKTFPDGVRLFDGETRIDGPWKTSEWPSAQEALQHSQAVEIARLIKRLENKDAAE